MAELGTGYISIIPEVSKISPGIAKALNDVDSKAESKGQSMGSKISSGIGKTLKIGVGAVGVAAGGAIATGMTKGMGRLTAIEGAQAKLVGLGNSSRDVSMIMDNALASVKGTAYGLDAAATTAAMAVASGVKPGQQLEQVLKTVADTAGIAGASMDDMGMIFGSVAARGKLQGDDLMQLQSRGIPVLQMVAEQMGITAQEASDMVSKGKVDFETFERALRENVGGAALEAGNTMSGAFQNMGAALGRAGATFQGAFVDVIKLGMKETTGAFDYLDSKLKPIAGQIQGFLAGTVIPGFEAAKAAAVDFLRSNQFQAHVDQFRVVISGIVDAGRELLPVIGNIGVALGQAGMQLGAAAWDIFSSALSTAASAITALSGPLTAVTGILAQHPALVTAAVAAWAGFKFLPSTTDRLSASLQGFNDRVGGMRDQFSTVVPYADKLRAAMSANGVEMGKLDSRMVALADTGQGAAQKMGEAYVRASTPLKEFAYGQRDLAVAARMAATDAGDGWSAADRVIAQAGHNMSATMSNLAGTMAGAGAAAFSGLKSAATGLVNAFGGPFNVAIMAASAGIAVVSDANMRAKTASEQYSRAVNNAATANREFTAAVAGTSGALSEQAMELAKGVVESSTAGLKAFQTQMDGFMFKIPAPDTSEFTAAIAEMALGAEWQEKAMWRGSKNWSEYRDMVGQVNQANQEMGEYLKSTGHSMEDLSSIVAQGGPEFDNLVAHMRGLGDGGQVIAGELERTREELELITAAAQRVDPSMVQASESISVLADSASSGQDKLSALNTLLQAMGLAPKDAELAMMDAAAAVDEIVEKAEKATHPVEQLGDSLFDMNGKLEPTNASARELSDRLMGMTQDLQSVAVNGGDVQAAFDMMSPAIAATAEEFNLTEDKVRELLASYGAIPEVLETSVSLEGASESSQEIAQVYTALEHMRSEGKSTIEISAVGDQAKAVMDELGVKWIETVGPDGVKNVKISAADDEAIASIQRVTTLASELGDREFDAKLLLDTTPAQFSAAQAQQLLDALDIQQPTPEANLIIDKLKSGQQVALGDLQFLNAQSANPQAALNKAALDQGVAQARGQMEATDRLRANPKVGVDNSQAKIGINQVIGWLASMPTMRMIRIITRREDNAADGLINYGAHRFMAAGGAQPMSQQPPQIAAGGRWITWAEDETHGESFIPHAMSKRRRSTQILAETASIFGLGLVDRGGNPVRRDGSSVAPREHSSRADGGVSADDVLRFVKGENVDGKKAPFSLEGAAYVWGGGLLSNWGDCSGAMSGIAAFITGAPLAGRKFATGNEGQVLANMGAKPGLGSSGARMSFGWFNGGPYGGHTSGTLHFGDGNSINLEMGGGRGNGQIGGAASGAAHSQYTDHAYLPLLGSLAADFEDSFESANLVSGVSSLALGGGGGGIHSTSTSGVKLKDGKNVSWGKAQSLFDQAKAYTSEPQYWKRDFRGAIADAMRLFDSGGVWKSGQIGVNLSGADEYVFTNSAMRDFESATREIRAAATELSNAFRGENTGVGKLSSLVGVDNANRLAAAATQAGAAVDDLQAKLVAGIYEADRAVLQFGRNLGGGFIGSAKVVRDAEQGLADTRSNIITQTGNVVKVEQEVAQARQELAEAEAQGGALSVAQRRKLEDAERKLDEARASGDAKKLADAELNLARAREDADRALEESEEKNAQEVKKAQDRLNKAEDQLRDARDKQLESLASLEAAERAVVAARYQAVADLATGIGEQTDRSIQVIAGLFNEFERIGGYVDNLRQEVSKAHMQSKNLGLDRLKSLADLQVKSADLDRTRLRGAISVAQAEYELEQARENAKWAGLTSIDAMSAAMDRFYETGVFTIEGLTAAEIENSKEVRAALWGVEVARKQAALDELDAARAREIAALRVAEATLQQQRAAQLLQLQTQHLYEATAQLNGMTRNQATGASAGFGGIGRALGGIGQLIGGAATAAAGFATGGPLGAIPGIIMAIKGLGATVQGSQLAKANRQEMDKAWGNMGVGDKAAIVGGGLLSGAAAGAGGVFGGSDGAVLGAELGTAILDASVGSVQHGYAARMDALERRHSDQMLEFERKFDRRENDLNMRSLDREIDYIYNKDRAEADLEYATMMREAVSAPTEKLERAFRDAAQAEKQRAERMHSDQMRAATESFNIQSQQLQEFKQVPGLLQAISKMLPDHPRSQVSGVNYLARV